MVCNNFHRMALAACDAAGASLPDPGLAWLPMGNGDDTWTRVGRCYERALRAALDYAEQNRHRMLLTVAGIVERRFPDPMRWDEMVNIHHNDATLEDHYGQIELIVNSKKVEEYRDILSKDEPLLVYATVDAPFGDGEAARERLRFNDAKMLSEIRRQKSSLLEVRLNADMVNDDALVALEKLLREHTGPCRTTIRMEIPKRSETVLDLGDDYKVAATDDLLARIEQLFGEKVAVLR